MRTVLGPRSRLQGQRTPLPPPIPTYKMVVADSSDRVTNKRDLGSATVAGSIAVYLDPRTFASDLSGIDSVDWAFDGAPYSTSTSPFMDLVGGTSTAAQLFNTASVTGTTGLPAPHQLTAVVHHHTYGTLTVGPTVFTVANPVSGGLRPLSTLFNKNPGSEENMWNKPFGDNVVLTFVGFAAATSPAKAGFDRSYMVKGSASDPLAQQYQPGGFGPTPARSSGTTPGPYTAHLPASLVVPDVVSGDTPNNAASLLDPDGRHVLECNAFTRLSGQPSKFWGYVSGNATQDIHDITGTQYWGNHGATNLSELHGAIRPGEIVGGAPIAHVMDLVLYAGANAYWTGSRATSFLFPGRNCDGYASATSYGGTNPLRRIGGLYGLARSATPASLGVTTPEGLAIFTCLKTYGACWTDDSAWGQHYITCDIAAASAITWDATRAAEFDRMVQNLCVAQNFTALAPTGQGNGGGAPRVPLLTGIDLTK